MINVGLMIWYNYDPCTFYHILLLFSRVTQVCIVAFVVFENIIHFLLPNRWLWEDKLFNETIMYKRKMGRFAAHGFIVRFYFATNVLTSWKRTIWCKGYAVNRPWVYITDFIHRWILTIKNFSQHFIHNNASDINHFS